MGVPEALLASVYRMCGGSEEQGIPVAQVWELWRALELEVDLPEEQARLAEGTLRDELRGPRLLDESVRARLHEARRRGSIVTVLDEGGLDDASGDALDAIRADLARALEGAASDRIYIRTSPHESIAVTVVGRSLEGGDPDADEVVDLWHEISHPGDDAR